MRVVYQCPLLSWENCIPLAPNWWTVFVFKSKQKKFLSKVKKNSKNNSHSHTKDNSKLKQSKAAKKQTNKQTKERTSKAQLRYTESDCTAFIITCSFFSVDWTDIQCKQHWNSIPAVHVVYSSHGERRLCRYSRQLKLNSEFYKKKEFEEISICSFTPIRSTELKKIALVLVRSVKFLSDATIPFQIKPWEYEGWMKNSDEKVNAMHKSSILVRGITHIRE